MDSNSTTRLLSRKVADIRYDDLDANVVRVCREVVLDGLAVMLAGAGEPGVQRIRGLVESMGGPPRATAIGQGLKGHEANIAFLNAAACHALDFEMMWYPPTHPAGTTLPAVLALAEAEGNVEGRQLIAALAHGFEVQGRLRLAEVEASGKHLDRFELHPPGRVGPIGSAVACGVLLGLDEDKLTNAIGYAASRSAGLMANTGTMTKMTHSAYAARSGVEAALLARAGFTAGTDSIGGRAGYDDVFFSGRLAFERQIDEYGSPFRMVEPGLTVKQFPAQYPSHWGIEAALEARRQWQADPEEISKIVIETGEHNESAENTYPLTGLDGKFSLAYVVVVALLDGRIDMASFDDQRRFQPDIDKLLERVEFVFVPESSPMDHAAMWTRVSVFDHEGVERARHRADTVYGFFSHPMSWDDRVRKFRDCAQSLGANTVDDVVGAVSKLEDLADVRTLMELVR